MKKKVEEAPAETIEETVKPQPPMLEPVKISELPTKGPKRKLTLTEVEQVVFDFYRSRERGQKYTIEQVAETLELTADEVTAAFALLKGKNLLPQKLGHII